jgi:hypothetical protein
VAIKSKRFDELIAEAERQPFAGWDFSYVKDRMVEATLPWDYVVEVLERLNGVSALLDLGDRWRRSALAARAFSSADFRDGGVRAERADRSQAPPSFGGAGRSV